MGGARHADVLRREPDWATSVEPTVVEPLAAQAQAAAISTAEAAYTVGSRSAAGVM